MLPEAGQVVAEKYEIEGRLGQGGMAVVFAAHHRLLDKAVAMKVLLPELPRTPQLVERFLAEARAAARVDSMYVARVIDAGTLDDGIPYIVMERLEGCDLEELLAKVRQLPIGDAVDHVLQALQGLAHAHVLGVIHRDLKPANLFLARQSDGSTIIKILDFGIAKLVDEARMIARGQTVGSPMYMSPEQVRDAELVDPRTDIWSIGVVLYELLTGHTPFEADGVGSTIAAVLQRTPASTRTLRPDIPAELDAAIMRCLHQASTERFADVAELAAAIAPFGTGVCAPLVETIEQTLRQEERRFTGPAVPSRPPGAKLRGLAPVRVAFGDESDERLSFLYGDSAPSSLQTNFLAFLGDALDFSSQVLVFDDVIKGGIEDVERLPREAADEVERLEALVSAATGALAGSLVSDGSPTARVAAAAVGNLESAVAAEVASLRASLAQGLAEIPQNERAARDGCAAAFEMLLLRHDLPGTVLSLDLRHTEERYGARLLGVVDYGLRWTLELEIPPQHPLARTVRLEKLARIEVQAPELTGWLRKEIKLRPQRLDRLFLVELSIGPTSMTMKLRTEADGGGDGDGDGEGFDVEADLLTSRFQLARPGTTDAPYDLSDADAGKLIEVHKTLLGVAKGLASSRKRLIDASMDDAPLWKAHEPQLVVERLVGAMAPIVRGIAMHSLSATELVLKRLLADDRREEVFVPKAMLVSKLDPVPDRLRAVVAPIVLAFEAAGIRASQPSYPRVP